MANEVKNKFNKTSSFLQGLKKKTADITLDKSASLP